jgi:hypothetical protein
VDGDVAADAFRPAAINQQAVADHNVEKHASPSRWGMPSCPRCL